MLVASDSRSPSFPVRDCRSDPAKSTRFNYGMFMFFVCIMGYFCCGVVLGELFCGVVLHVNLKIVSGVV